MAGIARSSVLSLTSQTAPKSISLTAFYGTNTVTRKSEIGPPTTIVHPSEQFDCRHPRPDNVSAPTQTEKRFVRNHGTSSFVDENARNLDFCFKKVRQYEFENFLCTLLLPEKARRGAIAVRAFNIEIAQVGPENRFYLGDLSRPWPVSQKLTHDQLLTVGPRQYQGSNHWRNAHAVLARYRRRHV